MLTGRPDAGRGIQAVKKARFDRDVPISNSMWFVGSAFRKHIMDKMKESTRSQPKHLDAGPAIPASDHRGAAEFYSRLPGDKPAEHLDWISDRKAFREALERMGDLRRWLHNKPILTDLEVLVMERDRQAKRMSSLPPETNIVPPPDAVAVGT